MAQLYGCLNEQNISLLFNINISDDYHTFNPLVAGPLVGPILTELVENAYYGKKKGGEKNIIAK
jgi:hypothetical protein